MVLRISTETPPCIACMMNFSISPCWSLLLKGNDRIELHLSIISDKKDTDILCETNCIGLLQPVILLNPHMPLTWQSLTHALVSKDLVCAQR